MPKVNVYGVILDCSAPYYLERTNKYMCTMKLIDDNVNPTEKVEFISVSVFSKTIAEIPTALKVGSVIRLHRASAKKFKNNLQLNCDVDVKGAWILFDPIDGVTPIAQSGRNFTFNEEDKSLLKSMRKFSKEYFAKNDLPTITLKKASEDKPDDFDTLVLVLKVKAGKDANSVTLCDVDSVVKLTIPKDRNIVVSPGEIIKIRSANYTDKKTFKIISLNEYSSILRVPSEYKSAKAIMKKVDEGKVGDKVGEKLAVHSPHLNAPKVGSKIIDAHKITKVTPLKELFSGNAPKGKFFKLQASVMEIGPKDPKEWICVMDKKAKKQ
jgi:hypothetical protein